MFAPIHETWPPHEQPSEAADLVAASRAAAGTANPECRHIRKTKPGNRS